MRSTEDQKFYDVAMPWALEYLMECLADGLNEVINMYGIGEVNTTLLADAIIYESDLVAIKDREAACDDETHPVWDVVIDASERFEKRKY